MWYNVGLILIIALYFRQVSLIFPKLRSIRYFGKLLTCCKTSGDELREKVKGLVTSFFQGKESAVAASGAVIWNVV
jgi:hypothetical protein